MRRSLQPREGECDAIQITARKLRQLGQDSADAGSGKDRIFIAGIVDPVLLFRPQEIPQHLTAQGQ